MKIVVAWKKYDIWHVGEVVYGPCIYPMPFVVHVRESIGYDLFGQPAWTNWVISPDVDPSYTELEISGPRCGATDHSPGYTDDGLTEPWNIPVCTKTMGHTSKWHHEYRDEKLWAEWTGDSGPIPTDDLEK